MDCKQTRAHCKLAAFKARISEHEDTALYKDILDDDLLLGFLRGKKSDIELALNCLQSYIYTRTKKYIQFTQTYFPSTVKSVLDLGKVRILRYKDSNGYFVAYDQINVWDTSNHSAQEIIAELVFTVDELIRSYSNQSSENRGVIILNTFGYSFQHAKQATPRVLLQMLEMLLNSVPLRPVAIHVLNEGLIVRSVFNLCRPFMKKKLRKRFHFHSSDLSSLHEHVPQSILPTSLGGHLKDEEAFDDSILERIRCREGFYKQLGELS